MHQVIHSLSLYQFKNYTQAQFSFQERIVCIAGTNGIGKTTLLDAIYYLCFTKSYFAHLDAHLVKQDCEGLRLVGNFDDSQEVIAIVRENGKKEFLLNQEKYTQFSKHIGQFSSVMISPDDTELITEGSEIRRKFLDMMLSQMDADYMQHLIQYNKTLLQRNTYLKQLEGNLDSLNQDLIAVYNAQLCEAGNYIFQKRTLICEHLKEKMQRIYAYLSDSKEVVHVKYTSALSEFDLAELLQKNLQKDIFSQRTNYGIHKDDLVFTMNALPFKQVASQGQRKTLLFGIKLAQFELLHANNNRYPILLLDDVFEKLDEKRSAKLIEYVLNHEAQVLITDTHIERLRASFEPHTAKVQYINLSLS